MFTCVLGRCAVSTALLVPQTFRRVLSASVNSCAEIKNAPSVAYVTNSGRVWREVPESDAWSVDLASFASVSS